MLKPFALIVFMAFSLGLFCVACAPDGHGAPVPCMAMENDIPAYHIIPPQGIPIQAGKSITVKWSFYKPGPDVQSPSTPVDPIQRATMQGLLFGPFPSRAAVDHLSGQSSDAASRGPILASSSLITTSGCTPQSFFNALTLPQHLKPGYYDLLLTGSSTYASGSSGSESETPLHVGP
jgi:hypothetical protein